MQLTDREIIAMAVACIAEETQTDINRVKVVSFHEIQKNSLERFIEMNRIVYKKFQLGDEML